MGGAACVRRVGVSGAACLPVRALGLLSRQADGGRPRLRRSGRRPRRDRRAAANREERDQGDLQPRQPDRLTSVRGAGRDRPDLLDERHHRHAQLHPADGERPRQLGDRVGAQLRGLRRRCGLARGHHLQRGPLRGGRGAGGARPHRRFAHPAGDRQQRAAHARDRPAEARRRGADPVVRRLSGRVGGRPCHGPRRVERHAPAGRGRARRRRAGVPGEARGRVGGDRHRGDGHRRHRAVPLGRVRGAGRDAPGRARLRPRRADRPRDGTRGRASRTARAASSS